MPQFKRWTAEFYGELPALLQACLVFTVDVYRVRNLEVPDSENWC